MVRLTRIDESNIGDHARLDAADFCLFLYEYTSGRNYSYSRTNQLISNLKKVPTSPAAQLTHKNGAIRECAARLREALNPTWLAGATLVPVPGSKARGDPLFDDRMTRVCQQIGTTHETVELVTQRCSTEAAHVAGGQRIDVAQLGALYDLNLPRPDFSPAKIGIVDDVLTAGTHFRAMHGFLQPRFPDAQIVGIFIARRIFPPLGPGLFE
jgi:predicted amidophosphoribosyltransferase